MLYANNYLNFKVKATEHLEISKARVASREDILGISSVIDATLNLC